MTAPDPVDILLWENGIQTLLSRWNCCRLVLKTRKAKRVSAWMELNEKSPWTSVTYYIGNYWAYVFHSLILLLWLVGCIDLICLITWSDHLSLEKKRKKKKEVMIFDESSTPSLSLGVDMFSSYLTAELLILVASVSYTKLNIWQKKAGAIRSFLSLYI